MRAKPVLVGFDIGGTHVRVAFGQAGEAPVAGPEADLPRSYEALLATLGALAHEASADSKVIGVGIGLPGVIRENRAAWVPNVPFVVNESLVQDMTSMLDAPVFLANDAQAALLGEARYGAAQGTRNAALFSLGTGIGGAILVTERVLRGAHGAAGAFGWVNVDSSGPYDPEHGQLELVASGRAIDELAKSNGRYDDGPAMVDAARRGDNEALRYLDECGRLLGVAAATIASTLDPEVILISGGVSDAFDLLEAGLLEVMKTRASPTARTIPVRVGALGKRAGAWGAVALGNEGEEAFLR